LNARRFVFLGVQKAEPFQVFYFEPTGDTIGQAFIQNGRERYRRLLSLLAKSVFRPSSWVAHENQVCSMPTRRKGKTAIANYPPIYQLI